MRSSRDVASCVRSPRKRRARRERVEPRCTARRARADALVLEVRHQVLDAARRLRLSSSASPHAASSRSSTRTSRARRRASISCSSRSTGGSSRRRARRGIDGLEVRLPAAVLAAIHAEHVVDMRRQGHLARRALANLAACAARTRAHWRARRPPRARARARAPPRAAARALARGVVRAVARHPRAAARARRGGAGARGRSRRVRASPARLRYHPVRPPPGTSGDGVASRSRKRASARADDSRLRASVCSRGVARESRQLLRTWRTTRARAAQLHARDRATW